jgi:hypothetical protein
MTFRSRVLALFMLSVTLLGIDAGSGVAQERAGAAAVTPLAVTAGGDTCATATVIASLPYNDSGDTTNATNDPLFLNAGCSQGGASSRPAPDVVYSITVFPGNSLTFTVNPSANFDASIYILSTCGNGSSCTQHSDTGKQDVIETIGPITLPVGTHYFYVDSVWDPFKEGPDHGPYTLSVTGTLGTPNNTKFYTLPPCRILDTRNANGPLGGPALTGGASRTFTIANVCLIPPTAKAVSVNATVTEPTAQGYLTLYPGGTPLPLASTINFRAGQTRANNAIVPLGANGTISVYGGLPTGNTTHFLLDVNGYFQ